MDIINIMLARAMTPQGQTETYVAKANAAAAKAAKAKQDADAAIASVTAAAQDIADTKSAAESALHDAQDALAAAQAAQLNIPTLYNSTGQNTDGTMTQKAITDALATKADVSALASKADASTTATKTYVDEKIAEIPSSGGNAVVNLDAADAGHLVAIDENGYLIASGTTENAIIEALLRSGVYTATHAVGLDIDYANRAFTRIQGAAGKSMGSDFNAYSMYGGRTRCNVADDGTINAFYGDNNYADDGSNGMVMVYQPKFYYKRVIREAEDLVKGKVIRHESLILSDTEQTGFKLAPIFSGDLDYVLLPAYDASLISDKLASVAGVSPVTDLTIVEAEAYARARGNGWHIMTMAAESANQMLQMVEYGTMNSQSAIEQGITYAPDINGTFHFVTGSTASLGNGTGHASSTDVAAGANTYHMNAEGYRAITYRGMENPWGNLWSMIGGFNIIGNGLQGGGIPYICTDFNYTPDTVGSNYEDIGFYFPGTNGWINAMGYGLEKYDWIYLPVEVSQSANSLLPVGDGVWGVANLNHAVILVTGGSYGFKDECGIFYYGADRTIANSSRTNYGAKLLYIPTKGQTYTANIAKWNTYMGG